MPAFNPFYGLAFNPFEKGAIKVSDAFLSQDFKEMSSRLDYLKDTHGLGVFTSRAGQGKSFGLRCFAKDLNPGLYNLKYMKLTTVTVAEFYKQFCGLLGVSDKGGKPGRFAAIQEEIYHLYKNKRQPLVLAIDEAQFLSTSILNDFKILMNQDFDAVNCFTLILMGEPYLNRTLEKKIHEALYQRITAHYDFQGLSEEEAVQYILHKITVAGSSKAIIEEPALIAIAANSEGIPRQIDKIMTYALMIGYQEGKKSIDSEVAMSAVNSIRLD